MFSFYFIIYYFHFSEKKVNKSFHVQVNNFRTYKLFVENILIIKKN
jgi:hypothetical protein